MSLIEETIHGVHDRKQQKADNLHLQTLPPLTRFPLIGLDIEMNKPQNYKKDTHSSWTLKSNYRIKKKELALWTLTLQDLNALLPLNVKEHTPHPASELSSSSSSILDYLWYLVVTMYKKELYRE